MPVLSLHTAPATIAIPVASSFEIDRYLLDLDIMAQRNASSLAFFAAMMPAIRAVARTSPFCRPFSRTSSRVAGAKSMRPVAFEVLRERLLPDTSTMRAAPASSTWLRLSFNSSSYLDRREALAAVPYLRLRQDRAPDAALDVAEIDREAL